MIPTAAEIPTPTPMAHKGTYAGNGEYLFTIKLNASPTANTVKPPIAVSEDPKIKTAVEENLARYNVKGVTATVADGQVTLSGEIPRAKLQDAMKAANEAKPKKVVNELTIK